MYKLLFSSSVKTFQESTATAYDRFKSNTRNHCEAKHRLESRRSKLPNFDYRVTEVNSICEQPRSRRLTWLPASNNLHAFLPSVWTVSADGDCIGTYPPPLKPERSRVVRGCKQGDGERRGRTLIRIFGFPIS